MMGDAAARRPEYGDSAGILARSPKYECGNARPISYEVRTFYMSYQTLLRDYY